MLLLLLTSTPGAPGAPCGVLLLAQDTQPRWSTPRSAARTQPRIAHARSHTTHPLHTTHSTLTGPRDTTQAHTTQTHTTH